MAERPPHPSQLARPGQSQGERMPAELEAGHARVDPRDTADLYAQARALAGLLRFHGEDPGQPPGDWSAFFPAEPALAGNDGRVPPHLGLFAAFLELYRHPQAALNDFTRRHLEFQLRQVLGFAPRPARADHAHLLLELKKGAAPLALGQAHLFSAGPDARGVERLYRPVGETVLNHGRVASLRGVYRDRRGVRFAPVADSADGLGGEPSPRPPGLPPMWRPFGGADLPAAPLGFALSAPVLRLAEGRRRIRVELELEAPPGADARGFATAFSASFEAHLSGPRGWLGPYALEASLAANRLGLELNLGPAEPAVVDYAAGLHGQAFAAQAPVLQLLLRPGAPLVYTDLAGLVARRAHLLVTVTEVRGLNLENDAGALNPRQAFQPFGPQPARGARFMIGCPEALSKRLLDLGIRIAWQAAPPDLAAWYQDYRQGARMGAGVAARLVYQDRDGQSRAVILNLMARDAEGATLLTPGAPPSAAPPAGADARLMALATADSGAARRLAQSQSLARPLGRPGVATPPPPPRAGFVTLALVDDFLHADYRQETLRRALEGEGPLLHEPYTPVVADISLSYQAQSDLAELADASQDAFTGADLRFFHVGCFGQRQEHAFLRQQLPHQTDKRVPLLPDYPYEGELLIGLDGVAAGDSVSLLLQVAEGSGDPDLAPAKLGWSVLADNHWRPVGPREGLLDGSRDLGASGILALALPRETSTEHTWMPPGLVWLRAAAPAGGAAACQLLGVYANAVEVRREGGADGPDGTPLPPGSIGRLKTPLAAVKGVRQPHAGFGGRPPEDASRLARRAAERLRHRQRCLTPWDYERMVLEAFPQVALAKCIPHAGLQGGQPSWRAPGQVLLVVVPDPRGHNGPDPLRPRMDADTLGRIGAFLREHGGMGARITVRNPRYQRVRLDFKVRLGPGQPFNAQRAELEAALIRALSPWAFDPSRPIRFGGHLYRSALLDLVEALPYVDFVSDFRMGLADAAPFRDTAELLADTPDAILVSAATHAIAELD